jgi:hypothetical protein
MCSVEDEGNYTVKAGYNFVAKNFLLPLVMDSLDCRLLNSVCVSYAAKKEHHLELVVVASSAPYMFKSTT